MTEMGFKIEVYIQRSRDGRFRNSLKLNTTQALSCSVRYGPKTQFLTRTKLLFDLNRARGLLQSVEKGSIKLKKAPSFSFCKEGILVDGDTETVETDMVILATGFKGVEKLKDILVSPTF
ncbi:hypothetical protein ACSBR2_038957 [Camellia fascicularis]